MAFDIEKIIALVPGNVFWKDKDGYYLGCNDNHAKLFNLKTRQDIIGKKTNAILDDHIAKALDENDQAVIDSGKEYVFEETGLDPEGNPAVFLTRKLPIFNDDGEVEGLLGISMDITLRKQYEEELRTLKEKAESASHAKSEFIMNMSHDLRTPMTGILGFADILKLKEEDEEKREMIELLESSANRLMKLLNDIVGIVEAENDNDLNIEAFSLRDVIEDNFELMRPAIEYKGLTYIVEIDDAIPYQLVGDRKRLAQILINLTGNAVKFTEKGHVKVAAKVLKHHTKTGQVTFQISVEDTGIGIDKKHFSDIFDKFAHLSPGEKEKFPGTGLGLWLVQKIVKDLNGSIDLDSEIGKGTTFRVTLDFKSV